MFTTLIILNIIHLLLGRQTIDFIAAFARLREFAVAGVAMIPMPWRTYFWLVLLTYFASIIYFFKSSNKSETNNDSGVVAKAPPQNDVYPERSRRVILASPAKGGTRPESIASLSLLIFSANLSFFAGIYYIGRSHPAELYTISLFILLNAFLLLGRLYQNLQTTKIRIIFMTIIFLLFILYPVLNRTETISSSLNTRIKRLVKGNIFKPEMDELLEKKYSNEVNIIKQYLPEKEVLIISGDDTYLLYLSKKTSLLSDNSLVNILTKQDLQSSLKKVLQICPKKIVGECRLFRPCPETELFSKAFYAWQAIILKEIESGCKIKYKPIQCTDQLCLALAS